MKKTTTKHLVHTVLIAVGVVCFWRGAWGLMDLYLFPNKLVLSYSIALLVGLIMLVVTESIEEII